MTQFGLLNQIRKRRLYKMRLNHRYTDYRSRSMKPFISGKQKMENEGYDYVGPIQLLFTMCMVNKHGYNNKQKLYTAHQSDQ